MPSADSPSPSRAHLPAHAIRMLPVLALLSAVAPLATDLYLPAFPAMAQAFNAPASRVQLTLTAFLLGMALGQLLVGPLSDGWGRRRLLLAGDAIDAQRAAGIGLATAVAAEDDVPAAIKTARRAAARLDPETVAALHGRTRSADDAGDLAALARSVARPGLKDRIIAYRAQARAR